MSVFDEHMGIDARIKEIQESGNYPQYFWRADGRRFSRDIFNNYVNDLNEYGVYTFEEVYRSPMFSTFPPSEKPVHDFEEVDPFMRTFEPEIWQVKKDTIYAAITAVEDGLEFAKSSLEEHDLNFGRTTKKNKTWAETIEASIRHMELTLTMLKGEPQK